MEFYTVAISMGVGEKTAVNYLRGSFYLLEKVDDARIIADVLKLIICYRGEW